jgi:hypothetical protein
MMTRRFYIRLSEREYARWEEQAKENSCTVSEWVRRRTRGSGRLRPARRPAEVKCEHGIPESQWPCPNCDAIIQAEEDRKKAPYRAIKARNRTEQAHRAEAERLAHKAGGAERWLAGMSASDPWFDEAKAMAGSERASREAEEQFRRDHNGLSLYELLDQQDRQQEAAEAWEQQRKDRAENPMPEPNLTPVPEDEAERRRYGLGECKRLGGVQNWFSSLPSAVVPSWRDLWGYRPLTRVVRLMIPSASGMKYGDAVTGTLTQRDPTWQMRTGWPLSGADTLNTSAVIDSGEVCVPSLSENSSSTVTSSSRARLRATSVFGTYEPVSMA